MGGLRSLTKPVFAASDRILRPPRGPRLLIYHQVGAGHGRQTDVTVEDFRWQVDWLAENREVVDLESALSQWDSPEADRLVVLTFDDGYPDTFVTAFPLMKAYSLPFTIYIATEFVERHDSEDDSLSWQQLNEMVGSGLVTIGAHTHSHVDLRSLNESEVLEEIEASNALLESRLGISPRHFAYPWGYWAEAADRVIRDHYSSATLGAQPLKVDPIFDPHLIHRFPVQLSDGRRWFGARLNGGLRIEEEARRLLRGYRGP